LNVFRSSIPVNPKFTLGDYYALSVLSLVLWTVIDAFAFPVKEGEDFSSRGIMKAHYVCIGIVSIFPGLVLIYTMYLFCRYTKRHRKISIISDSKSKSTHNMIKEEWKAELVPSDHLK